MDFFGFRAGIFISGIKVHPGSIELGGRLLFGYRVIPNKIALKSRASKRQLGARIPEISRICADSSSSGFSFFLNNLGVFLGNLKGDLSINRLSGFQDQQAEFW